jgi:hypothetical protein
MRMRILPLESGMPAPQPRLVDPRLGQHRHPLPYIHLRISSGTALASQQLHHQPLLGAQPADLPVQVGQSPLQGEADCMPLGCIEYFANRLERETGLSKAIDARHAPGLPITVEPISGSADACRF